jgi:hypothetical protein
MRHRHLHLLHLQLQKYLILFHRPLTHLGHIQYLLEKQKSQYLLREEENEELRAEVLMEIVTLVAREDEEAMAEQCML